MDLDTVMKAWIWPPGAEVADIDAGLINQTHGVMRSGRLIAVLQRLNTDIFAASVHEDIHAITTHLHRSGMTTPHLVPTADGPLWYTDSEGGVWRVLTPVGDRTVHKIAELADAESAGALVARFHRSTANLEHAFRFTRPGAHDTDKHMTDLRLALMMNKSHRLYKKVAPLAESILDQWDRWQGPTDLPTRIIHGDLKISNIRFTGSHATALIDLDTLAHGTIDVELGDAMRSWCNRGSEDQEVNRFDLEIFEAAMRGYRSEADLTASEWAAIGGGIERICIELAARFARDALEESYFGWNPTYGTRGDHNLLRARGQASLGADVAAKRGQIESILGI